jgi:hypothetical protein
VASEANASAVSWAAVIAGAFVMAALSLVLLALGAGFGLSSVSPWSHAGASAAKLGKVTIAWLFAMQIIASAMGGFLAGRLRTKWTAIHSDEVYFRDTAHGFLAWAVSVVITAAFLASAAVALVGGNAASQTTARTQSDSRAFDRNAYFVDALFRSDHRSQDPSDAAMRSEADRIFANVITRGEVPAADRAYLTQLVASKTGLDQRHAEKRVDDIMAEAREAAEKARSATAHLLLWTFVALLIGAFCASFAATMGGRQRDHMKLA